jgi:type 1 fimbriae regulatory protein FimB
VKLCRVPARDITAMAQALVEANPTEWLAKAKASSVVQDEIRRLQAKARTIVVRRLKGSRDSTHCLERDEMAGLRRLPRHGAYVFVNERGAPFGRMGIARMIERTGKEAKLGFGVHVHMLRHACGYALANKGVDTRRLQHYLGHASITNTVRYSAMSPEPFRDIWR